MNEIWEALRAPFPPHVVSWRVGATNADKAGGKPATKGIALAYIDARDVMERLDAVLGPNGWQNKYSHANGKTVCDIGVRIEGGEWIWKADGAGDTDTEAEKGALSDAFKRAAVRFGIGRYLYSIDSPWVELEQRGRSYVIKKSELPKLQALLAGDPLLPSSHGDSKPKAASRDDFQRLQREMEAITRLIDLATWRDRNLATIESLPNDWKDNFRNSYIDKQRELKATLAA